MTTRDRKRWDRTALEPFDHRIAHFAAPLFQSLRAFGLRAMFLVTGGAGFIGSNAARASSLRSSRRYCCHDTSAATVSGMGPAARQFADFVPPVDLGRWLGRSQAGRGDPFPGAISSTTATDGDAVIETNFPPVARLLDWCTATRTPFIYASSAATYGTMAMGGFRTTGHSRRSRNCGP